MTSAGIVLLAHGPDELDARVLGGPLPAFTASTMTSPRHVRAQIAAARRRQGFALLRGHYHEGVAGVTVPVHGGMGQVAPRRPLQPASELVPPRCDQSRRSDK